MDWKTCATDVSPIVQPCRVWQHWENLISASDDCAHAPGKPKRFSLAAHVHATMAPAPTHWNRRPASGTNASEDTCLSSSISALPSDAVSMSVVGAKRPITYVSGPHSLALSRLGSRHERKLRSYRNDAARIQVAVALIVVALDMAEIHSRGDALDLE
jgi:hypothetical protein